MKTRALGLGEERLWHAARPPGHPPHSGDFTKEPDFNPEEFVITLEDGVVVGRMRLLITGLPRVVAVDPTVVQRHSVARVVPALLAHAIGVRNRLGRPALLLILQDQVRDVERVMQVAMEEGFRLQETKVLFALDPTAKADGPTPVSPKDVDMVPWGHLTEQATLVSATEGIDVAAAQTLIDELAARAHAVDGRPDVEWLVAILKQRPVGFAMPAMMDASGDTGTNLLLGVVPTARRLGIGRWLHAQALQKLSDRGARRFIGSTEAGNLPMIGVFTNLGYTLSATQRLMVCTAPPAEHKHVDS